MARTNHPAAICTDRFVPLLPPLLSNNKNIYPKEKKHVIHSYFQNENNTRISLITTVCCESARELETVSCFSFHHAIEFQSNFKRGKFCVQCFILSIRANIGDIKTAEQNIFFPSGDELNKHQRHSLRVVEGGDKNFEIESSIRLLLFGYLG